MRCWGCRN